MRVRVERKLGKVGRRKSFVRAGWRRWLAGWGKMEERRGHTSWVRMVRMKVRRGVISGRTAKEVSPTRPRVTLVMASRLTGR